MSCALELNRISDNGKELEEWRIKIMKKENNSNKWDDDTVLIITQNKCIHL